MILVYGIGYVGLSVGMLLALSKKYVKFFDINKSKIDSLNKLESPIKDKYIEDYLKSVQINIDAELSSEARLEDLVGAEYIIIATPTNYDDVTGKFDTSSIETILSTLNDKFEPRIIGNKQRTPWIVIKSTIPVGYTESIQNKYHNLKILFSPEFLREGHALEDNLKPSRIIVGTPCNNKEYKKAAEDFAALMKAASWRREGHKDTDGHPDEVTVMVMGSREAESVKLFSNTYLAMRVAFFNELDTYAVKNNMDTSNIINGVCLDSRIGDGYNNPQFGYGGYCLPKDTKQLVSNFENAGAAEKLIRATVESNETRLDFIAHDILKRSPSTIGIYRLTMKEGSDNFRESAIIKVMHKVKRLADKYNKHVTFIIYEPSLALAGKQEYQDDSGEYRLVSLRELDRESDIIVANRWNDELKNFKDIESRIYTRDIFNIN